jgi:hypothetical protein
LVLDVNRPGLVELREHDLLGDAGDECVVSELVVRSGAALEDDLARGTYEQLEVPDRGVIALAESSATIGIPFQRECLRVLDDSERDVITGEEGVAAVVDDLHSST